MCTSVWAIAQQCMGVLCIKPLFRALSCGVGRQGQTDCVLCVFMWFASQHSPTVQWCCFCWCSGFACVHMLDENAGGGRPVQNTFFLLLVCLPATVQSVGGLLNASYSSHECKLLCVLVAAFCSSCGEYERREDSRLGRKSTQRLPGSSIALYRL